jgi:hypothetical protein
MSQSYSTAEVAKHKSEADGFWLIVEGSVYDVTSELVPYSLCNSALSPFPLPAISWQENLFFSSAAVYCRYLQ